MSDHIYEVEQEGLTILAIRGKDGTRLVGVPDYEAWTRDAIEYTCEALNAEEITEDEAHQYCTEWYKYLRAEA